MENNSHTRYHSVEEMPLEEFRKSIQAFIKEKTKDPQTAAQFYENLGFNVEANGNLTIAEPREYAIPLTEDTPGYSEYMYSKGFWVR